MKVPVAPVSRSPRRARLVPSFETWMRVSVVLIVWSASSLIETWKISSIRLTSTSSSEFAFEVDRSPLEER